MTSQLGLTKSNTVLTRANTKRSLARIFLNSCIRRWIHHNKTNSLIQQKQFSGRRFRKSVEGPPFSNRNQKVFPSSSFQTHSIPLLYMISVADSSIPVVFINTGFLFSETLSFCDEIIRSDQDGF